MTDEFTYEQLSSIANVAAECIMEQISLHPEIQVTQCDMTIIQTRLKVLLADEVME